MFPEKLAYTEKPLCSRKITNQFENQSQIYEDKKFCCANNKAAQDYKNIHILNSAFLTQTNINPADINPPRFKWGFHTTGN